SFSGNPSLRINNTNAAVSARLSVGLQTFDLDLPAGPYVRVEGRGLVLTALGQTLSGDFAFEQVTSLGANGVPNGGDDIEVVRVGATNVTLALGDGATDVLTVSSGSGAIFVVPGRVFGEITGTVALAVPSIWLTGAFKLQFNTGAVAVQETLRVGVVPVQVQLPAGPYVRVAGTGVGVSLLGQTLTGDFAFERTVDTGTTPANGLPAGPYVRIEGGATGSPVTLNALGQQLRGRFVFEETTNSLNQRIVRVAASGVEMSFANGSLVVRNGDGVLLFLPSGTAGRLSADVGLAANTGVALRGSFAPEFNTTGQAVSQPLRIGANTTNLDPPAGPFLRVSGQGVSLVVAGQTLSGDFAFEQITLGPGPNVFDPADDIHALRIAATQVSLSLGDGSV